MQGKKGQTAVSDQRNHEISLKREGGRQEQGVKQNAEEITFLSVVRKTEMHLSGIDKIG